MFEQIIGDLKDVESIKEAIKEAEFKSKGLKVEILKHYLLNYSIYNTSDKNTEINDKALERLKECTILFKKLLEIERSFGAGDVERKITDNLNKNKKFKNKKKQNPRLKYKNKANKQKEELNRELNNPKKRVKKF